MAAGTQKETPAIGRCFFLEVTPGFEMPEQAFDLFFVTLFRVSCVCFHIERRKNKTAKAYLRLSNIDLLRENKRENF